MEYIFHKDIPGNQWNVFKVIHGIELYVCSFSTMEEAKRFCETENNVMANYV